MSDLEILGLQNPREEWQNMMAHRRVWKALMRTEASFQFYFGGRGWGKGLEYIDYVIQRVNRAIKPENISEILFHFVAL